jgi:hypothetical protein
LPAVDEELGPGDEAVVVGSEEDGGAGDVIGIPNMSNRDGKGQAVGFLFAESAIRINDDRTHVLDVDPAARPRKCKRAPIAPANGCEAM